MSIFRFLSFKVLVYIAIIVAGVMSPSVVFVLAAFCAVTLISLLLGSLLGPFGLLGRFAIPHGLIAGALAIGISMIPPLPGLSPSNGAMYPTAPPVGVGVLQHAEWTYRWAIGMVTMGAAAFALIKIHEWLRRRVLIPINVHSSVARSLADPVLNAGVWSYFATSAGALRQTDIVLLDVPKQRVVIEEEPVQTVLKPEDVPPALLKEENPIITIAISPAQYLDPVVARCISHGIDVEYGDVGQEAADIMVPRQQERTVREIIAQVLARTA